VSDGVTGTSAGGDRLGLASQALRQEAVCHRFESAWRAGRRPTIEDQLAGVPEAERPALLRELILIEVELRQAAGESPTPEEYERRFPGQVGPPATNPDRPADPGRTSDLFHGPHFAVADMKAHPEGRFRVLRFHAEGGLGAVYVARDEELGRDVAIKTIKAPYARDPDSRARFLLEAEVTGGLEHPGIVPVYGLDRGENDRPFYAMRFIRGESLKEAVARFHRADGDAALDPGARSLELRKLLRRFVDVCNAVDYAHSRGVIHRDLKPGNIMLGPYGETLVVDWGLAKVVGRPDILAAGGEGRAEETLRPGPAGSSPTRSAVGTPQYMSPEQAAVDRDQLGPRSDIYSLGAILYSILTGRAPIEKGDLDAMLGRATHGEFARPRQVKPTAPAALEAVCLKAMSLRPEDRYATARDLADEVEHWLADEPVRAWREPWSQRLSRWARRNRSRVTAAAVSLVIVSVVSISATILIDRARRQARTSLAAESIARAESGRRLIQARESIDTLLTGVGEGLARIPGAQKVRRQLLEKAAAQYRQLAGEKGDDPALRLESGSAYSRLGSIRVQLGDTAGAEADFRAAESSLAGIAGLRDDPQVAFQLGQARVSLGETLERQGRFDESERAFRRAIDGGLAMARTGPDDVKRSVILGRARYCLARMLTDSKRKGEAEELFRSGLPDLEAAAVAGDYPYRKLLAAALNSYGSLLHKLDRCAEAEAQFAASIAAATETVRRYPEEFDARSALAIAQRNLGAVLDSVGRGDEAERLYLASLAEREAAARDNPDVPAYRLFRASSRTFLGYFYKDRNRYREAEEASRAAIADLQALVREFPDNREYRDRLGMVRESLGSLLMQRGRFPEADEETRMANDDLRALWDANPTILSYGHNLGNSLNTRARILRRLGRLDEAEAVFRDGLDVFERLAKQSPEFPNYLDMIALISNNIANLLKQRHRAAAALPMARRSVAGYEALTRDHPKVLDYAEGLVMSRDTLGSLLLELGSNEEARNTISSAVAAAQALATSHPERPLFLQRLIDSKQVLALAEARLGRFDDAMAILDDVSRRLREAVAKHPESAEFQREVWSVASRRAEILLDRGRPDQAVKGLEALSGEPCPWNESYYIAAHLYARAAGMTPEILPPIHGPANGDRIRSYGDHAIELLQKAVVMGFRDVDRLAQDRDLDPLRLRPDFRILTSDLTFPADPFAPPY
jgi:eukaryotic-like serine/threonine-protein kinase